MSIKNARVDLLKVLSRDEMREIHYATLEVLQQTGVVIKSDDALKVLENVGAEVDYKEERARIPQHLVEESIKRTPHGFRVSGRNPKKYCKLEGNRVYFTVSSSPPHVIDLEGRRRPKTVKDCENLLRLMDFLEHIDVPSSSGMLYEEVELPEAVQRARARFRRLKNTDKPGGLGASRDRQIALDSIRMACVIRGDIKRLRRNPMGWGSTFPVSPLIFTKNIEAMLIYARHGLPIAFSSEIMGSATGPATLAGILVQHNAENLAGITVGQMAADPKHRPPVLYGCYAETLDQREATPASGSSEEALLHAASAQLAKYYGMPCHGGGGYTQSKVPDAQAGYESMMTLMPQALAGMNYIVGGGGLEPGVLSISYEKYVLDNDMIGMVKRIIEGINITDETLAVDVIDKVGPGGHFLSQKHTKKWIRKEHYFPSVFDRRKYEDWVRDGAKDARMLARDRAKRILEEHQPNPLDKNVEKEFLHILREIERREMKK
jgi:trimethylamine--corrinoid protein Co-methyltransferase